MFLACGDYDRLWHSIFNKCMLLLLEPAMMQRRSVLLFTAVFVQDGESSAANGITAMMNEH